MGQNIYLIIHNTITIVSTIALFGIALFTYLNNRKKTANIVFSLFSLSIAVFTVSHVIGVNISDSNLSRLVLMFNLSNFFIASFNLHAILAYLGKDKEKKWLIIFVHASAVALSLFFCIYPDLFLLPSEPKMYFPNYYSPGILNWTRLVFMYLIIIPYMVYQMYVAYQKSKSPIERTQYKFFILPLIVGYALAYIPNFLVFNVPVDPLWGMLFSTVYAVPFIYGTVKYGMLDVQVVAKQAFFYSLAVGLVGGLITVVNYFNYWVREVYPQFPSWITAAVSSVLAVSMGVVVWRNLRQIDVLKYEFINTVTHKFRTPLTRIKWATEIISSKPTEADLHFALESISNATSSLVELTSVLVQSAESENLGYKYKFLKNDLSQAVQEVVLSVKDQVTLKHLTLTQQIEPNIFAAFDSNRLKFVIQVFIENAIRYTPDAGSFTVSLKKVGKDAIYSVHDNGIGISHEEASLTFSKFHRSQEARLAYTEGMGIGLFISKEIIERHGGKISAVSDGLNKGSTFSFLIKAV